MIRLGVFVLFALFTTMTLTPQARAQHDQHIERPDVITEANGISSDDVVGRNLFGDVVRSISQADAAFFESCFDAGALLHQSRHRMERRDVSLTLFLPQRPARISPSPAAA